MDLKHGLLLFVIGITISVVGMFIAYYIGSKPKKKKEINPALKDLYKKIDDLNKR